MFVKREYRRFADGAKCEGIAGVPEAGLMELNKFRPAQKRKKSVSNKCNIQPLYGSDGTNSWPDDAPGEN
jgi:hypothetical protein